MPAYFGICRHWGKSGVSDQPVGDSETMQGARNRAKAAFDEALKQHEGDDPSNNISPDFGEVLVDCFSAVYQFVKQ